MIIIAIAMKGNLMTISNRQVTPIVAIIKLIISWGQVNALLTQNAEAIELVENGDGALLVIPCVIAPIIQSLFHTIIMDHAHT